jgi:hypothetical protein
MVMNGSRYGGVTRSAHSSHAQGLLTVLSQQQRENTDRGSAEWQMELDTLLHIVAA